MKKMIFGITLILLGMVLFLFDEMGHIYFLDNPLAQLVYVMLPFVGFGISVWGFLDKENK